MVRGFKFKGNPNRLPLRVTGEYMDRVVGRTDETGTSATGWSLLSAGFWKMSFIQEAENSTHSYILKVSMKFCVSG